MKKIFKIFAIFVFVLSCCCLSACKDKYEDMKFEISYSFDIENEGWTNAIQNISCIYGSGEGDLKINEDGLGYIYIKVDIKGVKPKYLDDIVVTKVGAGGGLNFSNIVVKPGQTFKIAVDGNEIVKNTLKFYETKSGKSKNLDIYIYQSLDEIAVEESIIPAVVTGREIDLLSLNNLIYKPVNQTNQLGALYSLSSIGYYDEKGEYRTNANSSSFLSQYFTLTGNKLAVKSGYSDILRSQQTKNSSYIVRVKATSTFYDDKFVEFDVLIVDPFNIDKPINAYYESDDKATKSSVQTIELYPGTDYASTAVCVDYSSFSSPYISGVRYKNTTIMYELVSNVSNNSGLVDLIDDGLQVENTKINETAHINTYQITMRDGVADKYVINFALVLKDLTLFDEAGLEAKSFNIAVNKKYLPTAIFINNSKEVIEGKIYSTKSDVYQGLSLTLEALPYEGEKPTIFVSSSVDLESGEYGAKTYQLQSGDTLTIKYPTKLSFSVLASPESFDNVQLDEEDKKYIKHNFTVTQVTTADSLSMYVDPACTTLVENTFFADANNSSTFYVKANYTGTALDASSIVLNSTNKNIQFSNGSDSIKLSEISSNKVTMGSGFAIFPITIKSAVAGTKFAINAVAGEGLIGVDAKINVEMVNVLTNPDTIDISSDAIEVDTNQFAIEYNKLTEFNVKADIYNGEVKTLKAIYDIKIETNPEYNLNRDPDKKFSTSAVRSSKTSINQFTMTGYVSSKTQVFNVDVYYYIYADGVIVPDHKEIQLECAVYNPVAYVNMDTSKDELVYINSYFTEASKTTINFKAFAERYLAPTESVNFTTASYPNVSGIKLSFDKNIADEQINILYNGTKLTHEVVLSEEEINSLAGEIQVELTGNVGFTELTIALIACKFGNDNNAVGKEITLKINEYGLGTTGIEIYGGDLVNKGLNKDYVYMTFAGVNENSVTKTYNFNARAVKSSDDDYGDLAFSLFQVARDKNGIQYDDNGNEIRTPITGSNLIVNIDEDGLVSIYARKILANGLSSYGGLYILQIATKDSYNDVSQKFNKTIDVYIDVSDGSQSNRYLVNDWQDLFNIKQDLDAHYALNNNITIDADKFEVIQGTFNGSIVGNYNNASAQQTSKYKITYTANKSAMTDASNYVSLFSVIGENAYISDIELDVAFDEGFEYKHDGTQGGYLLIAPLAGENNGLIKNVDVTISSSTINLLDDNVKTHTYFGGLVAINNGEIDLYSSSVAIQELVINSGVKQHKHIIGGIAGQNNNIITGNYAGLASLQSVKFTCINNISIINKVEDSSYQIGGIAGSSSGLIRNCLVGGKISVSNQKSNEDGIVGGVVGNIALDSKADALINVATLGLDLDADTFIVGGIAGQTKDAQISNVRVMSAEVKYFNSQFTANGIITGKNKVAGIVADAYNTDLSYGAVESFIEDKTTITSTTTLAGLMFADASSSVTTSFVHANVQALNIYLTSNIAEDETYFIGNLTGEYEVNSTYAVVNGALVEPVDIAEVTGGHWLNDNDYNKVGDVVYPYLVDEDGNTFLIIRPTEIKAELKNGDCIVIIIKETEEETVIESINQVDVSEIAIINYYRSTTDPSKNIELNTYDILDLITLTVVPTDAQAGIAYQVVLGAQYAYVTDNGKIVFTAISEDNPILVKCYSLFNPKLEEYVVFYTQYGLTELYLQADGIQYVGENEYELTTYTGSHAINIDVLAKNIKNGQQCISCMDRYIDALDITTVDSIYFNLQSSLKLGNFAMTWSGEDFDSNSVSTKIKFALVLNLTQYFGGDIFPQINGVDQVKTLKTITLNITLQKSATKLEIAGEEYAIETHADVSFDADLYTGYYDANDTTEKSIYSYYNLDNFVYTGIQGKDTIKFTIEPKNNSAQDVEDLLSRAGESNLVDLFNYKLSYKLLSNEEILGYTYQINLELKKEFNFRYIIRPIELVLTVYANDNNNVFSSILITLKPTTLATINIRNYTASGVGAQDIYTNLVGSNGTETSVISPGKSGGVMAIYLEPSYANINRAVLTSQSLYVPELGKDVYVKFEQLVYNANTGKYETLYLASETERVAITNDDGVREEGIALNLYSQKIGGKYVYNGVIYVHTMLEKFVGLSDSVVVTLRAETNEGSIKTRAKTLLTQYLPGATISFDGYMISEKQYLIENGSSGNVVEINLFGYQFNDTPNVQLSWVDENIKNNIYNYVSYSPLDYKNAQANPDGSYTLKMYLHVLDDIPQAFKVTVGLTLATLDEDITSYGEDELIFYPTKYILNSMGVKNLNNGSLEFAIYNNTDIELGFITNNKYRDSSDDIYSKLFENLGKDKLLEAFRFTYEGKEYSFASPNLPFTVNMDDAGKISLYSETKFNANITLEVFYGYEKSNNNYQLKFGTDSSNMLVNTLRTSFELNIVADTDKEHAIPIYSAQDFLSMSPSVDYILMSDIILENYTPLTTAIASLDGNNKVIKIKSFAVTDNGSNYGLFANLGSYSVANKEYKSILQNVIVDYSELETITLTNNNIKSVTFGGLVAVNDSGLIYNCDVMNLSNSTKVITLLVNGSTDTNVVFGGLVGVNNGVITNSRVGRDSYIKITRENNGYCSEGLEYAKPITFVIGDKTTTSDKENEEKNGFTAIAGGFVGSNAGTIASSYVANTSVVNYSTAPSTSKTAGFVAQNEADASITYSYVRAQNLNVLTGNYIDNVIESATNGSVAGFVHLNQGFIQNSYANIELKSKSTFIAGFVFDNQGTIGESYSACMINHSLVNDYSEQPFVGVVNGELLSSGTIRNCYYLFDTNYDSTKIPKGNGNNQAYPVSLQNFRDSNNLIGFAFVLSTTKAERDKGVWSYYNSSNKNVSLPELIATDTIAHSYRYFVEKVDGQYYYANANKYKQGLATNPYTIATVEEFNQVFTGADGNKRSMSGYIRFIDNIDFNSEGTAINTRVNYTLGDKVKLDQSILASATVVEGNGLTISGIYLDASQANESSIGLFAEIENAFVKNLNLKFASPDGNINSSMSVTYSGGLAGKINDSVIINVNLDGEGETIVAGENFVGGLAGIITGKSLIYGVTTNLNVRASYKDLTNHYLYYDQQTFNSLMANGKLSFNGLYSRDMGASSEYYLEQLSYAGGLAGVIDVSPRGNENFNVSYININGNQFSKIDSGNISADYAGGIAGFAGANTNIYRAKYNMGSTDLIKGNYSAGGLLAVGLGSITASQVTAVEGKSKTESGSQYLYDTEFGKYIIGISDGEVLDETSVGNLMLIESYTYGGGLIGIGINALINSCYSKASFKTGETVGGLIGISVACKINFSYAVTFVNINEDNASDYENIGGLIGVNVTSNAFDYSRFTNLFAIQPTKRAIQVENTTYSDIQFTFSTVLANNKKLDLLKEDAKVDYVCAYNQTNGFYEDNKNLLYVYAGVVKHNSYHRVENNVRSVNSAELEVLYDVTHTNHELTFNNIFSSWPDNYWTLDPDRYFPLLLNKISDSLIIIRNENDFMQLGLYPDKNFKIIADIDMSKLNRSFTNYIFDVEFRGTIIGEKDDGSIPTIKNLTIDKTTKNSNVGLFRATNTASIKNLNLEWGNSSKEQAINITSNVNIVSALSCEDIGSMFSNLDVKVKSDALINTTNNIAGFGGLVGNATNASILSCKFSGSATAKVNGNGLQHANIGGLVGSAICDDTILDEEGIVTTKNMLIMNSSVDKDSNFTFDVTSQANIGGAVGLASGASIYALQSGEPNNSITLDVKLNNTQVYVGGLVANAKNTHVTESDADTQINLLGEAKVESEGGSAPIIGLAGLIGYYEHDNIDVYVEKSNANTQITQDDDSNVDLMYVSTGIAQLSSGVELNINQCLFKGDVSISNVGTIYAGGLVAEVGNGTLKYGEIMTMSNFLIGSESTNKIYAGGLIGSSAGEKISLNSVLASGKIVPTSNIGSKATDIKLGGLFGNVSNLTTSKVVSLTSLILDGLDGSVYKEDTSINALFGSIAGDKDIKDTYYSTDLALAPEDSLLGTNLPAYSLLRNNIVAGKFVDESAIWANVREDDNNYYLPYIISLKNAMASYQILDINNQTGAISYKQEGTQLNPVILTSADQIKDEFTYYLLNGSLLTFDSELIGVLIGFDTEYEVTSFKAVVAQVDKHSAVSNIHIKLKEKEYSLDGLSSAIVTTNDGVIFNSSVQGTGLELTGTASVGLISATNNGLIAYSYSSAEILSSTVAGVGGITYHQNENGKMISNYFTGYINNVSNDAAGIMVIADSASYAYNCYMAGVITKPGQNSFVANGTMVGNNNFIDSLANIETVDGITTETFNIMSLNGLKGNWHSNINMYEDGNYYVNTNASTYGYNYLYPVYNMNKQGVNHYAYQLYTGKGYSETYNLINNDYADRLSNADYLLIPHLGVFSIVQGLTDTYVTKTDADNNTTVNPQQTSLSYMFIYDIDGKDTTWSPIGRDNDNNFGKTEAFSGLLVSNKNYKKSTLDKYHAVTIKNLNGSGLCDNITNAYFGFIKFGDMSGLSNSGVLGKTVTGTTTVNSISLDGTASKPVTLAGTDVGGLFGTISGNVTISGFVTGTSNNAYVNISGSNSSGLIASSLTSGTVTLSGNTLNVIFSGPGNVGGLVGTISGGKICGDSNIITIADVKNTSTFGGLAGIATGGEIDGITVKYSENKTYYANTFGALVGEVQGNITITATTIDAKKLAVGDSNNTVSFAGYLAGQITGGTLKTVANMTNEKSELLLTSKLPQKEEDSGFGALVGKMTGGELSIESTSNFKPTIKVYSGRNLGGYVGYFAGGTISGSAVTGITLQGADNVGGVFGYSTNNFSDVDFNDEESIPDYLTQQVATLELLKDQTATEFSNWGGIFGVVVGNITGFTNHNPINLNSSTSQGPQTLKNVGGIAGIANGVTISGVENKANITLAKVSNIISYSNYAGNYSLRAINVGGIVGYANNVTLLSATNTGSVSGYQNVGGLVGLFENSTTEQDQATEQGTLQTSCAVSGVINVGGAFGYVINSTISKVNVSGNVSGNANVGGLVGATVDKGEITISNNTIQSTTITGIILCITINKEGKKAYYIPTSVGGLIGTVQNGDAYLIVADNTLSNITISSAEEGVDDVVISTVSNYMAPITVSPGTSSRDYKNMYDMTPTDNTQLVSFNNITSGFGGFIGTIADNSLKVEAIKDDTKVTEFKGNTISALTINATLGINVGTYYGYYYGNFNKTSISGVSITDNVGVTGAYNIGGVVGCVENKNSKSTLSFSSDDLTITNGSITINGGGMYVGGLFGKVIGNAKNLVLTDGITIDTANSYYIGGLVGRLEGNLTSDVEEKGEGSEKVTKYVTKFTCTVSGNAVNEFGGLVGLLKVQAGGNQSNGGRGVTVAGYHECAFTVNTIENSNYKDGNTTYTATEKSSMNNNIPDQLYINTQAYYVNLDTFNISPSYNSHYAGNTETIGNILYNHNPFYFGIEGTARDLGWAKEYTLFKSLQRCIPKGQQGAEQWDSIAVIYDASFIIEVKVAPEYEKTNDGEYEKQDNFYIYYTIYEDKQGSPMIYAPFGIGSMVTDSQGNPIAPNKVEDEVNDIKIKYGEGTYINCRIPEDAKQTLINWRYGKKNTSEYYYYRAHYTIDDKEVYFIFDRIYDADTEKSPDGSIFNVSGRSTHEAFTYEPPKPSIWDKILAYATVLVSIGIIIASIILLNPAIAAVAVSIGAFGLVHGIELMVDNSVKANTVAQTTYLDTTYQSYGFMSSTYNHVLAYEYDDQGQLKMVYSADEMITEDNLIYLFYSSVRPADWYSGKYFVLKNVGGTLSAESVQEKDINNGYVKTKDTSISSDKYYYILDNGTFKQVTSPSDSNLQNYYEKVLNRYIYRHGVYYINALAQEFDSVRYQGYEDQAHQTNRDYVINSKGEYYVRGTFDGTTYNLDTNQTRVKYDSTDKKYTVNGVDLPESIATYKKDLYYQYEPGIAQDKDKNGVVTIEDNNVSTYYYYGYGYMKNAYYSMRGDKTQGLTRYATYTYTSAPDGNIGYDYINATLTLSPQTYYYVSEDTITVSEYDVANFVDLEKAKWNDDVTYNGVTFYKTLDAEDKKSITLSFNQTLSYQLSKVDITVTDTDKYNDTIQVNSDGNVYVKIYPEKFIDNPYTTSIANVQDNNYYIESTTGLKYRATYYYYEDPSYISDGNSIYDKVELSDADKNTTLELYLESNGTYNKTIDEISLSNLINKWDEEYKKFGCTYKDLYIKNGDQYIKLSDIWSAKDNKLYEKSNTYYLEDGLRCYSVPVYAKNAKNNWLMNKYCMNYNLGIYTRYKYADQYGLFESRKCIEKPITLLDGSAGSSSAYIVPDSNSTKPNAKYVTILVESVKLTIGGGNTYLDDKEDTNPIPTTPGGVVVIQAN